MTRQEWNGTPGSKGDPLERVYTPDPVADACAAFLLRRWGDPRRIINPCVGAGVFVQAWQRLAPGVAQVGMDLDPDASGLLLCDQQLPATDYLEQAATHPARRFDGSAWIVDNPPFSKGAAFARASLRICDRVALLLPAGLAVRSERTPWPSLFRSHPCREVVINGRPWPGSREMALYLWDDLAPLEGVLTLPARIDWK